MERSRAGAGLEGSESHGEGRGTPRGHEPRGRAPEALEAALEALEEAVEEDLDRRELYLSIGLDHFHDAIELAIVVSMIRKPSRRTAMTGSPRG